MIWCPYCRKYVRTNVNQKIIKMDEAGGLSYIDYHCAECSGFIKSEKGMGENNRL